MYSLRSSYFIKKSAFNVAGNLVMVGNRLWNSCSKVYLVTLADIQDTSAREVARSHLSCILSFDLIGEHKDKRFYVMEIELPRGFADVIFRRQRSDNRKCVSVRRLAVTQPEVKFPARVWCTGSETDFSLITPTGNPIWSPSNVSPN